MIRHMVCQLKLDLILLLATIPLSHICHADNAAAESFVSGICVSCWHVHIPLLL